MGGKNGNALAFGNLLSLNKSTVTKTTALDTLTNPAG